MTWIKIVQPNESPEVLEAMLKQGGLYPPEYKLPVEAVKGESIVLSHSLLPETLYHAFATFGTLMSPNLPLSRKQHEMIAATVSVLNHCFY